MKVFIHLSLSSHHEPGIILMLIVVLLAHERKLNLLENMSLDIKQKEIIFLQLRSFLF